MKLLKTLKRQPAENCLILTYNIDLLFFEHLVFGPLYSAGCRNFLVMCDPTQYEIALDDISRLEDAGQRYTIIPGMTSPSGAFHPKLILMTSEHSGRLFIQSGNLTRAGYCHNWEVTTLFDYNVRRPDPISWNAIHWAFHTVNQIARNSECHNLVQDRLDQLLGTTSWLRQEPPLLPQSNVWLLNNLDANLLDQLLRLYVENDNSPIIEAQIISPFFDSTARAILFFLRQFNPSHLKLFTQPAGLDESTLHQALSGVRDDLVEQLETKQLLFHLALENRWLHAKAIHLRTEMGSWLVSGSANFSRPAWLNTASSGNTEIVVARYETDSAYFDLWLSQITRFATPLYTDPIELPANWLSEARPTPNLELVAALIEKDKLRLILTETIPQNSELVLHLSSDYEKAYVIGDWRQTSDYNVILSVPDTQIDFEIPIALRLEVRSQSLTLYSNTILIHNPSCIQHSSRPVTRKKRPKITTGLVPENYEHCAYVIDMLCDLLATNHEQLRRHQGRIGELREAQKIEQKMILEGDEEEYNPEDHFVPEQVRYGTQLATSTDLYADFDDRLTYEEILNAIRAALFQLKDPHQENPAVDVDNAVDSAVPLPLMGTAENIQMLAQTGHAQFEEMIKRIERSFGRLVRDFCSGLNDPNYLDVAPAGYVIELFVIISTYLRVVWREELLDVDSFIDYSFELLSGLLGEPGETGAWARLNQSLDQDDLAREEDHIAFISQTWFHIYMLADFLREKSDRRYYDLASLMRKLSVSLGQAKALLDLHPQHYARLWRSSMRTSDPQQSIDMIVANLKEIEGVYDHDSLRKEISSWPGARARISLGSNIADLARVPKLEISLPMTEPDWDLLVETCTRFLRWPEPKWNIPPFAAWVRISNTNALEKEEDIESISFFYRGDSEELIFAALRHAQYYDPEIEIYDVTGNQLHQVSTLDQLLALS